MNDLEAVLALVEKATPGEFIVKHGTNVMAGDGYSATSTASNFMDAYTRNEGNAAALVAALNYLRAKAPALREAVRIAEAVKAAPVGTVEGMTTALAYVHFVNDDADKVEGQRVRLVPDDGGDHD